MSQIWSSVYHILSPTY